MCCDFLVLLLAFALATRLSGCLHYQPCGMVVQQEVVRAVLWLGSPLAPLLRASPGAHAALLVTCCACYQIEWLVHGSQLFLIRQSDLLLLLCGLLAPLALSLSRAHLPLPTKFLISSVPSVRDAGR